MVAVFLYRNLLWLSYTSCRLPITPCADMWSVLWRQIWLPYQTPSSLVDGLPPAFGWETSRLIIFAFRSVFLIDNTQSFSTALYDLTPCRGLASTRGVAYTCMYIHLCRWLLYIYTYRCMYIYTYVNDFSFAFICFSFVSAFNWLSSTYLRVSQLQLHLRLH